MARTRFSMANERMTFAQAIPGIDIEWCAGYGVTVAGGYATPWNAYVGSGGISKQTVAGPTYTATDSIDSKPSVLFSGAGERSILASNLEADGDDFGIVVLWRVPDTTLRCCMSWSQNAESTNSSLALYVNNTGKVTLSHINDAGVEVQVNDTFTIGTTFHVTIIDKASTTLRLKNDARTAVTGSVSGACTFDRLILGAQKIGASHFYPFSGAIRQLAVRKGSAFTTNEIAEIYALANLIAPGIP